MKKRIIIFSKDLKFNLTKVILICLILLVTKLNAQIFTNYTTANGVSDNFVTGIAIDTNNVKWVSTGNGIGRYNDTAWTSYKTTNGLIDNYVLSIAVDKSNNVWAGTNYGVSKFNGSTFTNYTTTQGLIDNSVNYIYAATDGNVWFATQSGVSKYNSGTFTNYTTSNGLPTNAITYINGDATGNIWFATQMGGILKYNNSTFINYSKSNIDSLLDDNVFAIGFDQNNNRYIGTFYGITVLNSSNSWVKNIRSTDGLYNDFIRDIKYDGNGSMWVGVFADYNFDGGISHLNNNNWISFTVNDGLVNTQVTAIAIDKNKKPWIATGGGISYLSGTVGVKNIPMMANIEIYPNPASEKLNINCNNQLLDLKIMDCQGKLILSGKLNKNDNYIDIKNLNSGIYIVKLSNETCIINKKIIVR